MPRSGSVPRFMRELRRLHREVRAVSPVIGAILIIFIVIISMAGILIWATPAIQALQERADYQSVLTQMLQLNGELRALRDPLNTRQVVMSINQGAFRFGEGARWVNTVAVEAAFAPVQFSGWESDASATLTVSGVPVATDITVDEANGGTFTSRATAAACSGTCAINLGTYRLDDKVTRVQFKVSSVLKAEAWILEGGRFSYAARETSQLNRIHMEMGAVFSQQDKAFFVEDRGSIKEPAYAETPMDTSFLHRFFQLQGDTSGAGKGRHTVEIKLVDNYGLSRNRPVVDVARSVRLQIDDAGAANTKGTLEEALCNHFKSQSYYTQTTNGGDCAAGDVNLLYDPPDGGSTNDGKFTFQWTQTVVNGRVRTGA